MPMITEIPKAQPTVKCEPQEIAVELKQEPEACINARKKISSPVLTLLQDTIMTGMDCNKETSQRGIFAKYF
jgi:hypothetical protein